MPVIKHDSPLGALEVPLLRRVLERGEECEVSENHARRLLPQEIWVAVDAEALAIQEELDAPPPDDTVEDGGLEDMPGDEQVDAPAPAPKRTRKAASE